MTYIKKNSLLCWLTLIGLIFAIGSSQAQTAIPTQPSVVLIKTFELVSVQTFRSNLILEPPASAFASVSLMLTQEGWSGESISVDLGTIADIAEPYTDFTHLWRVDPSNPPILFRDLTFTWSFTLNDGRTENLSSTVFYADPRADWILDENPGGRIKLAVPEHWFNPESLRVNLTQIYDLISANTGQQTNLAIVAFDAQIPANPCSSQNTLVAPQSEEEVPCNFNAIRAVYESNGYTILETTIGDYTQVQDGITGLLFDTMYAGGDQPATAWFNYGLRVFYAPSSKLGLLETSRASVRVNRAISDMSVLPTGERLAAWRAQSYGMVLYIAEQIGVPGLFRIASRLEAGESLDSLYRRETQQPLSGLIPAWSNWIYTRAAESAYQYNPYLPATPTPTPSLTRTPTLTRTPSPTIVPSLTPSVTGVLSATPTDTPTITLTPTLTVTPRPAGSLRTATPVPQAPSETPTNSNISVIIFSLGLLAMGVIGIFAILYITRPKSKT